MNYFELTKRHEIKMKEILDGNRGEKGEKLVNGSSRWNGQHNGMDRTKGKRKLISR